MYIMYTPNTQSWLLMFQSLCAWMVETLRKKGLLQCGSTRAGSLSVHIDTTRILPMSCVDNLDTEEAHRRLSSRTGLTIFSHLHYNSP